MSRAARALTRREGRPPKMLAAIVLAVACVLGACDSSTPTPPSSPPGSPAARVEASAPVQAAPSSGDPAPSASSAPQPTPTPDPETVRMAAAAGFQVADAAARDRTRLPWNHKDVGRGPAKQWGRYLAALRQLQVPADTAADLQDLIRTVSRLQAISGEGGTDNRLRSIDFRYQTRWDNVEQKMLSAEDRVRSDLSLPPLCRHMCG